MAITWNIVTLSNDPGFYSGLPYNLYMDRGNPIGAITGPFQQYQDPWWQMKSILKTAGWKVTAWGSGSSTGIYTDPFTSRSLSMCSDAGWWCLTQPGSSRSFVIQKSTPASASNEGFIANYHSANMRIKYSPGGYAISGTLSPTMTPGPQTGSQELVVWGGGTDALPTFALWGISATDSSAGTGIIFHCVAQTTGAYGFFAWMEGGTQPNSWFGFDPIITPNTGDTEPYVVLCDGRNPVGLQNNGNATGLEAKGKKWSWVRKGFSNEVSGAIIQGLAWQNFNNTNNTTTFYAGKPQGKQAMLLPVAYIATSALTLTCSYKGLSTMFKATNFSNAAYPPHDLGTLSVFSLWDTAVIHLGLAVPWFGTKHDAW